MEEKSTVIFKIIGLYRGDYGQSLHSRVIGKMLNTSHTTLLPYLKHLEQLKILNSKKVGRNKQYTLDKENALTKYYLIIAERLVALKFLGENFLIRKFIDHLNNIDVVTPLLLFGSYAKGYATEESDIDLFWVGKLSEDQLLRVEDFENAYGKQINVKTASMENFKVGLRSGDILIREVVKNHIVLCNPDPFVTVLWRDYVER